MSQNEELQPCRFCGGEGKETTYSGAPTIFCQGCNAMMGGEESRATEQDLRDDWNRSPWRTIDSAPKDGTFLIVFGCFPGASTPIDHFGFWDPTEQAWCAQSNQGPVWLENVTYWMPRPAFPPLPEVKP